MDISKIIIVPLFGISLLLAVNDVMSCTCGKFTLMDEAFKTMPYIIYGKVVKKYGGGMDQGVDVEVLDVIKGSDFESPIISIHDHFCMGVSLEKLSLNSEFVMVLQENAFDSEDDYMFPVCSFSVVEVIYDEIYIRDYNDSGGIVLIHSMSYEELLKKYRLL